jgi:hypothetical protein
MINRPTDRATAHATVAPDTVPYSPFLDDRGLSHSHHHMTRAPVTRQVSSVRLAVSQFLVEHI